MRWGCGVYRRPRISQLPNPHEQCTSLWRSPPCILGNVTKTITQPNASKQKGFPSVYRGILSVLTTGVSVRWHSTRIVSQVHGEATQHRSRAHYGWTSCKRIGIYIVLVQGRKNPTPSSCAYISVTVSTRDSIRSPSQTVLSNQLA